MIDMQYPDMAIREFFEDKNAPNLYAVAVEIRGIPSGGVVTLFGDHMPVLWRLQMKSCITRWYPFKDMVVLRLLSLSHLLTKEEIFWTLHHSPGLEVLSLKGSMWCPWVAMISAEHTSDDAVHLLCL